MNYRILIAEDEPKLRSILCDFFQSRGDTPIPPPTAPPRWRWRRSRNLTAFCWIL